MAPLHLATRKNTYHLPTVVEILETEMNKEERRKNWDQSLADEAENRRVEIAATKRAIEAKKAELRQLNLITEFEKHRQLSSEIAKLQAKLISL